MAVSLGMHDRHNMLMEGMSAVLTEGGGLAVCGSDYRGQLGRGRGGPGTTFQTTMQLIGGVDTPVTGLEGGGPGADTHSFRNEPLVMVATGRGHSAAVTDQGRVWVWGLNDEHQLGPITPVPDRRNFTATPFRWDSSVCGGSPVVMVACGWEHTLVLTRAGHVWSCGRGVDGKTGQAVAVAQDVLTQVPGVEQIAMVVAATEYSLAVDRDGQLWSWGFASKCPRENEEPAEFPLQKTPHIPRALGPTVFGGSRVLFVSAYNIHGAVVTALGELWVWGYGTNGCLGLGQEILVEGFINVPRRVGQAAGAAFGGAAVLMAACGYDHTVVLTDSGAVWTCGSGLNGALGHGGMGTCFVPTRIPQNRFEGHRIVSVAAGLNASMTVTAEGVLYSWGSGALGHGNPDMRERVMSPTAVAATLPPGAGVGRTCSVPPGHSLAFCMSTHARLGARSCAYTSASDDVLERNRGGRARPQRRLPAHGRGPTAPARGAPARGGLRRPPRRQPVGGIQERCRVQSWMTIRLAGATRAGLKSLFS